LIYEYAASIKNNELRIDPKKTGYLGYKDYKLTVEYFYKIAIQSKKEAENKKENWKKDKKKSFEHEDYKTLEKLIMEPSKLDVGKYNLTYWMLSFDFQLQKPYLSHDDDNFYLIESPVRKEWVFKVPYIAASQWKGMLRSAMSCQLVEQVDQISVEEFAQRRFRLALLFGNEKGESGKSGSGDFLHNAGGKDADYLYENKMLEFFMLGKDKDIPNNAGCLQFYPSYFKKSKLEIINPHNRETGTGNNPVMLEVVPAGETSRFCLYYIPLGRNDISQERMARDAVQDLVMVCQGIQNLFEYYGLGAKTSSGFGKVECSGGIELLSSITLQRTKDKPKKNEKSNDKLNWQEQLEIIKNNLIEKESETATNLSVQISEQNSSAWDNIQEIIDAVQKKLQAEEVSS